MTTADGNTLVEVVRDEHVLVIAMRREAKRNAIDRALADQLDVAFNELEDDPDVWVGVLTGTPLVFSAGSDLGARGDWSTERGGEYGIIRRPRRKPLIAAVEGPALGGGLEIALACDLVVASTSARFGFPEVRRGVLPGCAGLFRGPRALPLNLARELALTGDPIDATRAHAAGFVNVLTEPGQAVDAALGLARRICLNSPLAVQASLAAVNEVLAEGDDRGWAATNEALDSIRGTDDFQEGIRAFLDKRAPIWTGR
jgi:enoyl-CoA hydratase/carnithine racemase